MEHIIANRYHLLEALGRGGMGTVYLATDRLNGQTVALKRVYLQMDRLEFTVSDRTDDQVLALATEFRTLASLRHPHIISVIDYGFTFEDHQPQPFFTMEYLPDSHTITAASVEQPFATKVRLLTELLLGLAYLHRRGVIHRDLKPDNVLVNHQGQVKILDFGLASGTATQSDTNLAENTVGTLAYMAPELFSQENATVQSDLYAFGIIGYEIFTGAFPYNRQNVMTLINSILSDRPDIAVLDAGLRPLFDRLLAKSPDTRPTDAEQVIRELCAATGQPPPAESIAVRESFLQASRFVGREREMNVLKNALNQIISQPAGQQVSGSADQPVPDAASGTEQRVLRTYLIGGESGVGKSRLVDELRTYALVKGALVLRGQGVAEGGLLYQLWREPARRLILASTLSNFEASVLKELVPDIGTLLNREVIAAPELSGAAGQQRLVLTLVDLFKRQTQPVVLILEDLQWADESLEPLKQMLTLREPLPHLMVVVTYRDDERPTLPEILPGAETLKLARLDEAAIADLAESMLGSAGTHPEVIELINRETEGNAFFMVETVRVLAEEAGSLDRVGTVTLPPQVFAGGVQQIIRRRLDRVPAEHLPLLKLAAVAGRQLDLRVLSLSAGQQVSRSAGQRVSGSADEPYLWSTEYRVLSTFLTACADAAVLEVVDDQWRFTHDKIRETILADLPADARALLHRAVAQAVEAAYPDDPTYYEPLLEQWRMAGDAAKQLHYLVPVARHLVDITADYNRAIQLLERGLALPDDSFKWRAALLNLMSQAYWRKNDYATAKIGAEHAMQIAEQYGNRHEMAASLNTLANVADDQSEFAAAAEYAQRSLAIRREIGDQRGVAACLNTLGSIAAHQADFTAAKDFIEQSLVIRGETGDRAGSAAGLYNLGILSTFQGDLTTARDFFEQSLVVHQELGDRQGIAYGFYALGRVAVAQEDYATAQYNLQQSLAIHRATGDQSGMADCLEMLGDMAAGQGDYVTARAYFEQCLAVFRSIDHPIGIANALNGLGFVLLNAENSSEAFARFHEALLLARKIEMPLMSVASVVGLARLRLQTGDALYAAELAGLVDHHPAMYAGLREGSLAKLKRELEALLSPADLNAAMQRGAALDLNTEAEKLLQATSTDHSPGA